jgi:hypothetical protein
MSRRKRLTRYKPGGFREKDKRESLPVAQAHVACRPGVPPITADLN